LATGILQPVIKINFTLQVIDQLFFYQLFKKKLAQFQRATILDDQMID